MSDTFDHELEALERDWIQGEFNEPNEWWESGRSIYRMHNRICKFCYKGGFHWKLLNGKWRLFDSKEQLHSCLTKKAHHDNLTEGKQ